MPIDRRRPRLGVAFVLRTLLGAAFALLVGSCGSTTYQNGTPIFTVTSTNVHFTSFVVLIDSITLTRNDGNVFTAVGVEERADLTKVTDLTELLGAPAIPTGTYTQGTITLDFATDPPIINADVNGQSVGLTPVDTTGAALTTQTITFNMDPNKPLVINYYQGVNFGFEFDLAASSIINTATSTVTFTPVIVASTVLANSNPVHVRGQFLIANQQTNSFILNSDPFDDQSVVYGVTATYGAVTITVDANTVYDLGGNIYVGAPGLAAASTLVTNSPIAAIGTFTNISGVTPVLHATQVYAGNTLEGPYVDHMIGWVSSRSGNTLNVHGVLFTLREAPATGNLLGGDYCYFNDVPVTVGPSTIVNIDGSGVSGTSLSGISVGQQVDIIGQGSVDSGTNTDCTTLTMDATQGEVRLQSTRLWGTLTSATAGSLNLGLTSVGPFEVAAFNFAGTGTASASDANPASYVINTGTLDESATPAGTPLRVDGVATPFGSAPPDFTASAVASTPTVDTLLQVEWPSGTASPFSQMTASLMQVDLSNTALTSSTIDTGPYSVDVHTLSASPIIVPDPVNGTNYSVGAGSSAIMYSFTTFSGFTGQVYAELATKGELARKLVAVGSYDPASNTFTAKRIDLAEY